MYTLIYFLFVRIADKVTCEEIVIDGKGDIVQNDVFDQSLNAVVFNIEGHVNLLSLAANVFFFLI